MSESKKEFLTFRLSKEEFAVEILRVQEIRGWVEPTPLPSVPHYVKGVVDLRGNVVPIIDLREKFRLPLSYDATTVVIVVHVFTTQGERVVGLVVDAVSDVYTFNLDEVQPAPDISTSVDSQYIIGLSTLFEGKGQSSMSGSSSSGLDQEPCQGRMVILIDIDKLANDGLLSQVSQAVDNMPTGNG